MVCRFVYVKLCGSMFIINEGLAYFSNGLTVSSGVN